MKAERSERMKWISREHVRVDSAALYAYGQEMPRQGRPDGDFRG
jgi:hypothetical protein